MDEMKIITKGSELLTLDPVQFQNYVNALYYEKALINIDRPLTLEEEKEWLKQSADRMDNGELFMVVLLVDGKLGGICDAWIGAITLRQNVTFGISVSKEHRGKKHGTKMLKLAMGFAKEYFRPHKMWIEYAQGNEMAAGFYEKLGFKPIATLKEFIFQYGKFHDKVIMEYQGR